jgi:hypothetical protein
MRHVASGHHRRPEQTAAVHLGWACVRLDGTDLSQWACSSGLSYGRKRIGIALYIRAQEHIRCRAAAVAHTEPRWRPFAVAARPTNRLGAAG